MVMMKKTEKVSNKIQNNMNYEPTLVCVCLQSSQHLFHSRGLVKEDNLVIYDIFFLFFNKTSCVYSLEVPHGGTPINSHSICFCGEPTSNIMS